MKGKLVSEVREVGGLALALAGKELSWWHAVWSRGLSTRQINNRRQLVVLISPLITRCPHLIVSVPTWQIFSILFLGFRKSKVYKVFLKRNQWAGPLLDANKHIHIKQIYIGIYNLFVCEYSFKGLIFIISLFN